jgi:hypothetical protein
MPGPVLTVLDGLFDVPSGDTNEFLDGFYVDDDATAREEEDAGTAAMQRSREIAATVAAICEGALFPAAAHAFLEAFGTCGHRLHLRACHATVNDCMVHHMAAKLDHVPTALFVHLHRDGTAPTHVAFADKLDMTQFCEAAVATGARCDYILAYMVDGKGTTYVRAPNETWYGVGDRLTPVSLQELHRAQACMLIYLPTFDKIHAAASADRAPGESADAADGSARESEAAAFAAARAFLEALRGSGCVCHVPRRGATVKDCMVHHMAAKLDRVPIALFVHLHRDEATTNPDRHVAFADKLDVTQFCEAAVATGACCDYILAYMVDGKGTTYVRAPNETWYGVGDRLTPVSLEELHRAQACMLVYMRAPHDTTASQQLREAPNSFENATGPLVVRRGDETAFLQYDAQQMSVRWNEAKGSFEITARGSEIVVHWPPRAPLPTRVSTDKSMTNRVVFGNPPGSREKEDKSNVGGRWVPASIESPDAVAHRVQSMVIAAINGKVAKDETPCAVSHPVPRRTLAAQAPSGFLQPGLSRLVESMGNDDASLDDRHRVVAHLLCDPSAGASRPPPATGSVPTDSLDAGQSDGAASRSSMGYVCNTKPALLLTLSAAVASVDLVEAITLQARENDFLCPGVAVHRSSTQVRYIVGEIASPSGVAGALGDLMLDVAALTKDLNDAGAVLPILVVHGAMAEWEHAVCRVKEMFSGESRTGVLEFLAEHLLMICGEPLDHPAVLARKQRVQSDALDAQVNEIFRHLDDSPPPGGNVGK